MILLLLAAWTLTVAASPPALPPNGQMASALLTIAGEGFRIRETDHFTIAFDTDPEVVSSLVGRLEGTYDAIWKYCEGLGLAIKPPAERFGVLLFDRP